MRRLVLALLLALPLPLAAQDTEGRLGEEIVLGLSADEVAITVTFDGSDLLVFGAIRRSAPPPATPAEIVLVVSGPLVPVTVRRAERVAGIWMNTDAAHVDLAPSFYAVSTSGPLPEVLSAVENQRHSVTVPRAIRSVGNRIEGADTFVEALIRIREAEGLYRIEEGAVDFEEETLFSASVGLPANLTEGNYDIRIYLTRDRRVVDWYEATIGVQRVGIERWLYNLSIQAPPLYGLLALAIAALAGWTASAAARYLRR
ncbi:TIGR02186 family protein [Wenxinia saemankumensis]|uniref:Transmembrane protein (Alph_Pro_TM) n=1 Tax=Wenxinia saemankumensis TaxID=1447782 RepID=A0A1M6E0G7_9RHOB|nr:TIGR02186 family protein [Wenxinia saemankumensis]SHI78889.1 conserved hypothetical protein [Wenxinia saemankumensis]